MYVVDYCTIKERGENGDCQLNVKFTLNTSNVHGFVHV